jgi:hypothetical protein
MTAMGVAKCPTHALECPPQAAVASGGILA